MPYKCVQTLRVLNFANGYWTHKTGLILFCLLFCIYSFGICLTNHHHQDADENRPDLHTHACSDHEHACNMPEKACCNSDHNHFHLHDVAPVLKEKQELHWDTVFSKNSRRTNSDSCISAAARPCDTTRAPLSSEILLPGKNIAFPANAFLMPLLL